MSAKKKIFTFFECFEFENARQIWLIRTIPHKPLECSTIHFPSGESSKISFVSCISPGKRWFSLKFSFILYTYTNNKIPVPGNSSLCCKSEIFLLLLLVCQYVLHPCLAVLLKSHQKVMWHSVLFYISENHATGQQWRQLCIWFQSVYCILFQNIRTTLIFVRCFWYLAWDPLRSGRKELARHDF